MGDLAGRWTRLATEALEFVSGAAAELRFPAVRRCSKTVPMAKKDWMIACLDENLHKQAVQKLRSVLGGPQWRRILAGLPGYGSAATPGELLLVGEALPWWRPVDVRRCVCRGDGEDVPAV